MNCYITPIIDKLKLRKPYYQINDSKGFLFVPINDRKFKNASTTYRVAQSIVKKIQKEYGIYGSIASIQTFTDGTRVNIHPTKKFRDAMDLSQAIKEEQLSIDEAKLALEKIQAEGNWYENEDGDIVSLADMNFQPKLPLKPGVEDLFNENPELANSVYEALGIEINNFKLIPNDEKHPEDANTYDIIYNSEKIGIVALFESKNKVIKGVRLDEKFRNKGLGKKLYKFLNLQANLQGGVLISDPEQQSDAARRLWKSLLNEGVVTKATADEQSLKFNIDYKQQALQVYSQYLEQGGSQADIQGFKDYIKNDGVNSQPNLTQEQLQERGEYKNILEDLGLNQEEINQAQENFNATQDLDDIFNLQPKVVDNFNAISSNVVKLRDDLQAKYDNWKLANRNLFGTKDYKEKNKDYFTALQELNEVIQKLDTSNQEKVYEYLKGEVEELREALESYQEGAVKNENLIERIDFLHSYVTGEDLKGEPTDTWDFSNFPNYAEELFKPVSDLKLLLEEYKSNRVFEIIKNLPSYAIMKEENSWTDEEFYEIYLEAANEKLKDINLAQSQFLGLNANDDSIFAAALFDLYHSEIAKAKNPMRMVGRRMAELNDALKKEGFNFELFKEKNSRGVDTLLLAGLYSSKFNSEELPKFYKLLRDFNDAKDTLSEEKAINYKKVISWLKMNTDVIDYSKLSSLKNIYGSHPELSKYFIHSDSEMLAYENELKKRLGKEFDTIIGNSARKIDEYLERATHQELHNAKYANSFKASNNPFEFVNHFNSKEAFNPIKVSENFYRYNMSSHIEFIPLEEVEDFETGEIQNTGFYNDTFRNSIMPNPKAYELWSLMIDSYSNYINPTYIQSGQKNINLFSWAKLNSDLSEVILSNYNSVEGMKKIGKALIDTWKDSWYFTQNSGDPKELKANYFDTSSQEVQAYTTGLMIKSLDDLRALAKEKGIPTKSDGELLKYVRGEKATKKALQSYKAQLARDIALKIYSESKSGDIVKNTLALMELSAMHRARMEGRIAAEMLVEKHNNMKDDRGNVGQRKNSEKKINNWLAVNIYNTQLGDENVKAKALEDVFGKNLSDFEKNLKNILESLLEEFKNGEDISFNLDKIKYRRVGGKYSMVEGTNIKPITEEDFEKNLESYVNGIINSLGTPLTVDSVINGFITNMTKKAFAINPISGFNNRAEGKFTNMINDETGQFWTPGNNYVSERFLTFANILKLAPEKVGLLHKNHYLQLQTLQQLVEEMNILQDRKNEVEKKDKESTFGKTRKFFNWFALAVDNPEFKNQATIILNMLQDVKVKDNNGVEHNFFDSKTMSFTIYKPGTLELKPEFTVHNQNFADFLFDINNATNNKFYIVKERISDAISHIQGNYSNVDSIAARHHKSWGGVAWGKVLTVFMRWLPAHVNQRFGVRKRNYLQNKTEQKGRYRALWDNPYIGSAYISGVLAITLGPGSLIFGLPVIAGVTKMLYDKVILKKNIASQLTQVKTLAGFLMETLTKTIGMPLQMTKITKKGSISKLDEFSDSKLFKNLSTQDKGAIKAMAQELAIQLNILFVMLILKTLLHGGVGDDEDEKMIHHFIDNQGNRLINNLAVWSNPAQLVSDNTQFALLRSVKNVYKMTSDLWKMSQGDKIDEKRPILNIIKEQPFLPIPNIISRAIVKGETPGKDSREYQNAQWFDRYTKPDEWQQEQIYKKQRAKYKEAYSDMLKEQLEGSNLTPEELEELIESKTKSAMNKKNMKRKKGESFEDALKRINLDPKTIK